MTIDARFAARMGDFGLDAAFVAPSRGVTAVFGASGCGKTTVLRCIAGLHRADSGHLRVDGHVWQDATRFLAPHRRPIGYVFQEASLFDHLSVRANLVFGQRRAKAPTRTADADEVIALLGLEPLLERSPRRLSGGERQRVAIGRALLAAPQVLLMDEPLAALDRFSKNEILPFLERLHDHLEIPVLYVSHDLSEVERLADHMVFLEGGRVGAAGPLVDLVADPALPFARAPEAAAVVEGRVVGFDDAYGLSCLDIGGGALTVPGALGPPGTVRRLRVAASDVALCRRRPEGTSILNALDARIVAADAHNDYQINVFLALAAEDVRGPGARLMARITRKSWDALGLKTGEATVALVKSVALVDPP